MANNYKLWVQTTFHKGKKPTSPTAGSRPFVAVAHAHERLGIVFEDFLTETEGDEPLDALVALPNTEQPIPLAPGTTFAIYEGTAAVGHGEVLYVVQ